MVKTICNLTLSGKNLRMLRQICLLLFSVWLLTCCDSSTIMHSYQPLKEKCWDRSDTLTFTLPTLDNNDRCHALIGLRVTDNFPYEMLILEIEQNYRKPFRHRVDTVRYILTDKRGEFTEKGINYFQYETQGVPLSLEKGQTGNLRIRHLMHRETIPGIMDVGIHVIR